MRIRIKSLPERGEMDEYDLRRFRPGDVYDVASKLAALLILSGHAEPLGDPAAASEAADYNRPPRK